MSGQNGVGSVRRWRAGLAAQWLLLLRVGTSLTLVGRGWLTWRWDSPIRGLVWQEDWWTELLEHRFSLSWAEFAERSDSWITSGLVAVGVSLMVLAVVPLICTRTSARWTRWLLWPAFLVLLLDSFARWVASDYDIGMAIEHALQMAAPVALFFAVSSPESGRFWPRLVAVAAALTFVGHGLYAIGFHPVPLSYQLMTIEILAVEQKSAITFLSIVGWLDIVAAVLLFVAPLRRWALFYLVAWGLLTALARVVAHVGLDQVAFGLDPWLAETLVRTSHWLLPLLLLVRGTEAGRARTELRVGDADS